MNTKHALAFVIVAVGALAARAEETEVLFDGAGIGKWDTSRDEERLRREFAAIAAAVLGGASFFGGWGSRLPMLMERSYAARES